MKKSLFFAAVCALLLSAGERALAQTAPMKSDTTKVKMNHRQAKLKTDDGKAKISRKKDKVRMKSDGMKTVPQQMR
ncbi:hypothetical protein MUN82_06600 [Hymenobacter aerilatus]|uniref:Pentapeptide MXKDX repeat protein n=1 Tax=Hymenobacter aerilatus TaxID=2932251 RepID=A0A8T9SY27_9BACT|nr:hypothetical protein [Hymenobacter aerilatus]UOR06765.1 hypothetical protein MUN82_06600 [Hymenobacter aerilatus]